MDKMRAKLDKWWNLLLKGGRHTFAQSVLNSLLVYYFSILEAHKAVVLSMEKLMRDFIWNGGNNKKGNSLVNWNVASLLQKRGLEVGSLK